MQILNSIAAWIRDPIGSDRDVDDAPSLAWRLRSILGGPPRSHPQPKVLPRDLGIVSARERSCDAPCGTWLENLPCFRLTAFHLLFDVLREF